MAQDPFEVLGIAHDASLGEARAAHRRLLALFHPDHLQGMRDDVRAEGERRLREATEAMDAIRAGYRNRALEGLAVRNGLFGLFGTRRSAIRDETMAGGRSTAGHGFSGTGTRSVPGRGVDAGSYSEEERRNYNAQVRQVNPDGVHADWSGRHAAALWSAMRKTHQPAGPVFQVEWGAYECTLPGSEVRGLLESALPSCEDWRGEPLETFEVAGRRLIGTSAPQSSGSRDLGWLCEQIEDRARYLVTVEVF